MNKKSIIIKIVTAPALFFLFASIVSGSIPQFRTPLPVIYLEDNLDEKDDLGYCIDPVGRVFVEKLHAHLCKPPRITYSSITIKMKKGYNLRLLKVNVQSDWGN